MFAAPKRLALACALLATLATGSAHAQQSEADALFAQGRDLMEKGQFGDACAKLKRSEELSPAVGTLLNLGYCLEQLGRFRSAMEAYAEAEVLAGKTGDAKKSAFAKDRLAAVQPKVLKVVILVTPPAAPDLEVRRNGAIVPKTDWGQAIGVDPEEIVVSASAPGRASWKGVVMGKGEGATVTVFVPPLAAEGAAGPAKDESQSSGLTTRRIAALGLGAGGAIAIGAGIGTALVAKTRYDDSQSHCDGSGCDEIGLEMQRGAVTQGNVATALVGLGLLCAGAGTYLWIIGGEEDAKKKRTAAAPQVQWSAGLGPTGAAVGGRF